MAIMRAYLDDSGDPRERGAAYVTIAGYVATHDEWKGFEAEWNCVLNKFEVPYLHMKEWGDPNSSTYAHVKSDPVDTHDFMSGLLGAIQSYARLCTFASIDLRALSVFNSANSLGLDPYAIAIYGCIIEAAEFLGSDLEFVVDNFDKSRSRVALALEYAATDTTNLPDVTHIPLLPEENWRNVTPLQAADFVAWEIRKSAVERKGWSFAQYRGDRPAMEASYQLWIMERILRGGRLPHSRRSFRRLLDMPCLHPRGVIWDAHNLSISLERHPNGWTSPYSAPPS